MQPKLSLNIFFLAKRYKDSLSGLPYIAWKGILISLIESALIAICYYLSIYFVEKLHFSIFESSILIASYGIGSIIGALLGGKLSDTISAKNVSAFFLFLQSFGFFIMKYNENFLFFIPNLFIIGVASYGFITSVHVWVLAYCVNSEAQRLKAINILNVASNLGLGIAAIFISIFGLAHFNKVFLFSSILLLMMGMYFLYLDDSTTTNISSQCSDQTSSLIKHENNINKNLILYSLVCLFLMGIIISQFNSTYSLFLLNNFNEMGIKSFSIVFTINTLMVVFLQTIIVEIFNKKNKIIMIGFSTLILGTGMLLLNFLYHFYFAILSIIILTIGEMIFFSISQLICYENSSDTRKGQSMGIYRTVFATSRIIGPIIGGVIYQNLGGDILWYFCFLLGVGCLLPALIFKNKF